MPKKKEDNENHAFMFEDLAMDELKNKVVRLWKEIKSLEVQKKDYAKSTGDTIKELKEQIDSVVYWIGVKETTLEKEKLAEAAAKALE